MKITILTLIALLGFGCTAKKLAIDHADSLLTHQVTKRIPLYGKQKKALDHDMSEFLNRMKPYAKEILPVIDEVKLSKDTEVKEQYDVLESFFKKISTKFSALISKYLAKLDTKQQKDFFKKMEEENLDIIKKNKVARLDDIEERFELFIGKLNSKQKDILKSYKDYFDERASIRVQNRKKLHEEFRDIYEQVISEAGKEELFKEAFAKYQAKSIEGNKNMEIIQKLLPTVTVEQKKLFRTHIEEMKDLLQYFIKADY